MENFCLAKSSQRDFSIYGSRMHLCKSFRFTWWITMENVAPAAALAMATNATEAAVAAAAEKQKWLRVKVSD